MRNSLLNSLLLACAPLGLSAAVVPLTPGEEPVEMYWLGTAITAYHSFPDQTATTLSQALQGREVSSQREYVWPIQQLFLPDDDPKKVGHPSLKKGDKILTYIREEQPDFVVIQTTYDYFFTGEDDRYAGDFPLTIRKIAEPAAEYGGKLVFYETGWNSEERIAPARETLYELAEELGAVVAPCRLAQDIFRERHPDLDWTYEGDQRHPGKYFVLLNQLVFLHALVDNPPAIPDGKIIYRQNNKELSREERDIEVTIEGEIVQSMVEIAQEAVRQSQQRRQALAQSDAQ